jgi:flavin-binding protein dodecin
MVRRFTLFKCGRCSIEVLTAAGPRTRGHAPARGGHMGVAKVSEISATSSKSFEDAIQQGLARASKTLRHIRSAWIKEQTVRCNEGKISEYQVNMMVTFVLDD